MTLSGSGRMFCTGAACDAARTADMAVMERVALGMCRMLDLSPDKSIALITAGDEGVGFASGWVSVTVGGEGLFKTSNFSGEGPPVRAPRSAISTNFFDKGGERTYCGAGTVLLDFV
jgi:hypothetical protein